MEKITITEALSEVNLIKKKIVSKQEKIKGVLTRFQNQKDPYETEGGSPKVILSETQAIADLGRRLMKIRSQISQVNLENEITIGEETKSIHDWLVWKRELAGGQQAFVKAVHSGTKSALDAIARQPQVYKDESGATHLAQMVSNIDYGSWMKMDETITERLEVLDGKLSLKNATILVSI